MANHKCKVERNKHNSKQWLVYCSTCRDFWNSPKWELAIRAAISHRCAAISHRYYSLLGRVT